MRSKKTFLYSLIYSDKKHWCCLFIFIVASIVCGFFVLCPCFVMQYFASFLDLQASLWGRDSWLLYYNCLHISALCLFLLVSWFGLQCVIVAFPGHTRLLCFLSTLLPSRRFFNTLKESLI